MAARSFAAGSEDAEVEALSVSEALALAQEGLDDSVGRIAIEAEVFEYRGPWRGSGHYYFKLRDENAVMEVKMWSRVAARGLRCELEEGRAVLAHGRFEIYPPRGNLSFILDRVEDRGTGDLARRFEALRKRLRDEGLFDEERKRPLPEHPARVILITSYPSAASADVLQTLQELQAPFAISLRPALVQGEGAAPDLVRALGEAERSAGELILLARGGGSLEDLWAFNEEAVVRAVAECRLPLICAVGHESDFTLCDFAADERAKTPTAGAIRLMQGWLEARRRAVELGDELETAILTFLNQSAQRLDELRRELRLHAPATRLARLQHRVIEAERRLQQANSDGLGRARRRTAHLARRLSMQDANLARLARRLERSARRLAAATPATRHDLLRSRLQALGERLEAASPTALLSRGYALVRQPGEAAYLRRADEVRPGDRLEITLAEGRLDARVE